MSAASVRLGEPLVDVGLDAGRRPPLEVAYRMARDEGKPCIECHKDIAHKKPVVPHDD
jgi:hypothetical protein